MVTAELCETVPAAPVRDAADAAAYAQVGDDARATDDRIAAVAYRKALALDPDNAQARAGMAALCRGVTGDPLLVAIARFRARDLDGAAGLLTPLVTGANAAGAHFFLGLIALARHDGAAVDELAAAAKDPAYAPLAAALSAQAHRQGMVEALVLVAPELDTNPQLLPDTPPVGATATPQLDEDLLLAGAVAVRPTRWLILRDALSWRQQRVHPELDLLGNTAGVEVAGALAAHQLSVRYDLDYDRIGGAGYLVEHRGAIAYRRTSGDVTLVVDYGLRRRDFLAAAQDGFTGWVHGGDAGATLHLAPTVELEARATFARELTADATFSDIAVGTATAVRIRPRDGVRVAGTALGWYARYDGAEPDGEQRTDFHGELAADVELDLADHVLAIAGASLIGNTSSVDDFHYWRFTVRCGLAIALGGP